MYYLCKQNNSQLYMTDFKSLAQMRRSHRKFTSEEIDPEALKLILRAGSDVADVEEPACLAFCGR